MVLRARLPAAKPARKEEPVVCVLLPVPLLLPRLLPLAVLLLLCGMLSRSRFDFELRLDCSRANQRSGCSRAVADDSHHESREEAETAEGQEAESAGAAAAASASVVRRRDGLVAAQAAAAQTTTGSEIHAHEWRRRGTFKHSGDGAARPTERGPWSGAAAIKLICARAGGSEATAAVRAAAAAVISAATCSSYIVAHVR